MKQRLILTIILVLLNSLFDGVGYVGQRDVIPHILYPFFHANIFHLLGNILVLWMLRSPVLIWITLPIAIICSYIPAPCTMPTMGFSGVLFAVCGISWGRIGCLKEMCRKCLPFMLAMMLVPGINVFIHIYCLFAGYLVGLLKPKDFFNDPYNPKFLRHEES